MTMEAMAQEWFDGRYMSDMSPPTLKRFCIGRCADRCTKAKHPETLLATFTEAEQAGSHLLADDPLVHLANHPVYSVLCPQEEYWARVRLLIERAIEDCDSECVS